MTAVSPEFSSKEDYVRTEIIDDRAKDFSGVGRYINILLKMSNSSMAQNQKLTALSQLSSSLPKPYSVSEQLMAPSINQLGADLVHFPNITRPWLGLNGTTKIITTIHDLTLLEYSSKNNRGIKSWIKQRSLRFGIKQIIKSSDHLITPSIYVKNQLIHMGAVPDKISVIYLGHQLVQTKPVMVGSDLPREFFLYVGNAYPHKNLGLLVELLERQSGLTIVTAGDPVSGFEKYNHPRLLKLGKVSDGELAYLYSKAQGLIQPSLSEGFGLTGLEAMGYGCPVISSDATCLPEIYGPAALYFDPHSVEALERALADLPQKRDALVDQGYDRIKRFSWEKCAQETYQLYQAVLAPSPPPPASKKSKP